MTGIGKVDQIILQLRAQLQRAAGQRTRSTNSTSKSEAGSLERFRAIRGVKGYADENLRRRFVRALLTEELGEELANQPEFERISNEVWKLIEADEELAPQLDAAIRQLDIR